MPGLCVYSVNIKEASSAFQGWPLGTEAGERKNCPGRLAEGWQGPSSHSPSAKAGFAFLSVNLMKQRHYGQVWQGKAYRLYKINVLNYGLCKQTPVTMTNHWMGIWFPELPLTLFKRSSFPQQHLPRIWRIKKNGCHTGRGQVKWNIPKETCNQLHHIRLNKRN